MDYYRLQNIQADTDMRSALAEGDGEAKENKDPHGKR